MARPSIPTPPPGTARCCPPRCGSGAAGCSATAPARGKAARSPPSCSTTGCAAGAAALWLSQSDKLVEDARRDWTALGGRDDDVIPLGKFRQGAEIPMHEGILFATYATLRSPARQGKPSRLDQIVAWLAGSLDEDDRHAFDGAILFDEAHAMANAAGSKGNRGEVAPSQQGRAGLRLQNALPDARIAYVSATGATTVPGLAYAGRLGLWAAGETPFETRTEFVSAMEAGRRRGARGGRAGPEGAGALPGPRALL